MTGPAYIAEWEATGVSTGISFVGPFPDSDTAEAFAKKWEMGRSAEDGYGGFSGYAIVDPETAQRPGSYAAEYIRRIGFGFDEAERLAAAYEDGSKPA